jgi:hypothetical protein
MTRSGAPFHGAHGEGRSAISPAVSQTDAEPCACAFPAARARRNAPVAAKVLLDLGWGKPKEMHHSEVDDNKTLLKVVNEIVHVYETREQIEFNDQTPLLAINPSKNGGNTH